MAEIRVEEATPRRLERWDEFIARSVNGTLFHRRDFLAYHGDRFQDSERFLTVLDGDNVTAQIAVAVEGDRLRSPYGASYGGFVFARNPTFSEAQRVVASFIEWCQRSGIRSATLTPPIGICAPQPLDNVAFALLHAGWRSINRDISTIVALDPQVPVASAAASRARNSAGHAERAGVTVQTHADPDDFWTVMEATFARHGVAPTHSPEEFRWLADHLPENVYCDVAYWDGEPVAGVAYFVINQLVNSSFYLCQRPERRDLNGLTLCVLRGLEHAQNEGFRWLDFGTSTTQMQPRENVFLFKEQFTRVGQFRETFEWLSPEVAA